jgi:hypothetical protein
MKTYYEAEKVTAAKEEKSVVLDWGRMVERVGTEGRRERRVRCTLTNAWVRNAGVLRPSGSVRVEWYASAHETRLVTNRVSNGGLASHHPWATVTKCGG